MKKKKVMTKEEPVKMNFVWYKKKLKKSSSIDDCICLVSFFHKFTSPYRHPRPNRPRRGCAWHCVAFLPWDEARCLSSAPSVANWISKRAISFVNDECQYLRSREGLLPINGTGSSGILARAEVLLRMVKYQALLVSHRGFVGHQHGRSSEHVGEWVV